MLVKDFMTEQITTVKEDQNILEARETLRGKRLKSLPVVDDIGRVRGIVTVDDIKAASPSDASTLSRYEANYLMGRIKVKDIMTRSTINVFADDTVEYAAYLIYKNDVNALPVIDKEGKLCGIIAKSDMFRAFVGIMGMNRDCIRVTIEAEDKTGQLADVCNIYKNAGVNIITSSTRQLGNGKAQIIIRGEINENGVGIVEDLRQAGFNVIDVMKLDGLE
ncbi:MAG: CBS and ACT domain-containing protein [Phascolarctobacterium sp.]|nr:CBS and ACT domain-containing protein [Phascolarctobacterium sp.]